MADNDKSSLDPEVIGTEGQTPTIEPCPFCGSRCEEYAGRVRCTSCHCGYQAGCHSTPQETIAAHNERCRLVRLGKAAEKLKKNPPLCSTVLKHATHCEWKAWNAAVRACLDRFEVKGGECLKPAQGTWNYRVLAHDDGEGRYCCVHEVYYDEAGNITSWTERVDPLSEIRIKDSVNWVLTKLREAHKKPTLVESEDGKTLVEEKGGE